MSAWYYLVMGEIHGPVSTSELKGLSRSGNIQTDTFVRRGSDGRWFSASQLIGLFETGPALEKHRPSSRGVSPPALEVVEQVPVHSDRERTSNIGEVEGPSKRARPTHSPGKLPSNPLARLSHAPISAIFLAIEACFVSILWLTAAGFSFSAAVSTELNMSYLGGAGFALVMCFFWLAVAFGIVKGIKLLETTGAVFAGGYLALDLTARYYAAKEGFDLLGIFLCSYAFTLAWGAKNRFRWYSRSLKQQEI